MGIGSGRLSANPNPATSGQDVVVRYDGNETLYYSVDSGPFMELPIDPNTGSAVVAVPPGASAIVISTNSKNPTELIVPVVDPG